MEHKAVYNYMLTMKVFNSQRMVELNFYAISEKRYRATDFECHLLYTFDKTQGIILFLLKLFFIKKLL